jgi:phospholipid/cholesterol/gamma-HCH transport system permease protein
MALLRYIGDGLINWVRWWVHLAAVVAAVVRLAVLPRSWPRTVRATLARQILFSGIEGTRFAALAAFLIGVAVVVQAQLWLYRLGQTTLLGPLLVTVVVREVGPLLANIVAIGRTGNAIAVELANMKTLGEVRVLEAQGVDPLIYLVIPRAVGLAISVFCLTVVMISVALFGGYLFGALVGAKTGTPMGFARSIVGNIGPLDAVSVVLKATVPSLLAGTICCNEGLSVQGVVTQIPPAVTRAIQRSLVVLFVLSIAISLMNYAFA